MGYDMTKRDSSILIMLLLGSFSVSSSALTVPFTEDFEAGVAGWQDGLSATPTLNNNGGSDGGQHIATTVDVADALGFGGQTIFRCHASNGCSGGAFIGDWQSSVSTLSFDVMHDAGDSLGFFLRIATPGNFPAWTAGSDVMVAPNTWTTIEIDIDESNPALEAEFGSFAATFANVGNLQFGVSIPDGYSATGVTFNLDSVSIAPVPLPGAVWMLLSAGGGLLLSARRS